MYVSPARLTAEGFLLGELLPETGGGPCSAKELQAGAARHGISVASLRRAKKTLGVQSFKAPGLDGQWVWQLPPAEFDEPDPVGTPEDFVRHMLEAGWVPVTDSWEKWQWRSAPEAGAISRGAYYPFDFAYKIPIREAFAAWRLEERRRGRAQAARRARYQATKRIATEPDSPHSSDAQEPEQ